MFKNYLELNNTELEKLIEFINKNKENKLSFEEIDKQFKAEEYDFGRGVIFKVSEGNVIGRVSVVLKECTKKGIAYAFNLDLSEGIENYEVIISEIIEKVKEISHKYGANEIFLGVNNEKIIKALKSLNINKQYSSVKMTLDDRVIRDTPLNLIKLSENNKKEYLDIYNDAFKEVPNGQTLTENEVEDYVKGNCEGKYYYIVAADTEMIGFLQFDIKNGVGEFDLGLIKAARGRGYGKRLLETAINFLNSEKVTEISLTVITKNIIAYDMYKKRGFKDSKLINEWFQID